MTNMSIQPLWLTYFIEILLVLEFQLKKTYFGMFSYKAHFRPQISSNGLDLLFCVVLDQGFEFLELAETSSLFFIKYIHVFLEKSSIKET